MKLSNHRDRKAVADRVERSRPILDEFARAARNCSRGSFQRTQRSIVERWPMVCGAGHPDTQAPGGWSAKQNAGGSVETLA
jgi:hypothetical protein